MSAFNYAEVWPSTGWLDKPWRDDVEEEAFVKSARSITELYTEALAALKVQGHRRTSVPVGRAVEVEP